MKKTFVYFLQVTELFVEERHFQCFFFPLLFVVFEFHVLIYCDVFSRAFK